MDVYIIQADVELCELMLQHNVSRAAYNIIGSRVNIHLNYSYIRIAANHYWNMWNHANECCSTMYPAWRITLLDRVERKIIMCCTTCKHPPELFIHSHCSRSLLKYRGTKIHKVLWANGNASLCKILNLSMHMVSTI